MKNAKKFFQFEATSANQGEFNEDGEVMAPGGKDLAELICTGLSQKYKVTEIVLHGYYAWSWTVCDGKFVYRCLIHDLDPWLLTVDDNSSIISRIFGKSTVAYVAALDFIEHLLRGNSKFGQLRRMSHEEYYGGRKKPSH